MMKWFIKSGCLYWSAARGDWGSKARATAFDQIQWGPLPLAWDPQWVEEEVSNELPTAIQSAA